MARLIIHPGLGAERRGRRVVQWILRAVALTIIIAIWLLVARGMVGGELDSPSLGNASDVLRSQIETGEFAPAVATANGMTGTDRDTALAQIAQAQAAVGHLQGSLATAAQISDDYVFAETLEDVRSRPVMLPGNPGGIEADFESLIELIQSTIAPSTWDELGGPGAIQEFEGGIAIDAEGLLRPILKEERVGNLAALRTHAALVDVNADARQSSAMRAISLPRLERKLQLLAAQGRQPTEEMHVLAGLQRVKYVFVFPETRDLVIAGPAGDWCHDDEGRIVSRPGNRPVVRLGDLVVVLRHMLSGPDARFGCSITPTRENLEAVQAFLDRTSQSPLKPGQRDRWLRQLRETLGRQTIDIYGIDPRTRVGRTLVEADYRMKLIGMGLEDGVLGVPSYLQMVKMAPGDAPPPMSVLRWWFTLDYDSVSTTAQRNAFELSGQGVKVLSENELLTERGERVHTGESDTTNSQFARNFTKHFEHLAVKYPVYAELQNVCDLALVGAIIRSENLAEKTEWPMLHLGDPSKFRLELGPAPKSVETVINHRVVNRAHILVGVSGGVRVAPTELFARRAIKEDDYGLLHSRARKAAPTSGLARDCWWWD